MTDLDKDILELLDFEFAPPCEAPIGCDREAEWKVIVACCGHLYLLCQECVDANQEWAVYAEKVRQDIQCVQCDTPMPPLAFIYSTEKI